ncbi:hypothetical protein J6590_078959 [Homalodisca vitripennis]|nr:hypothetical protein J6590_078959 [Homalodisca vitripennis]
MDIYDWVSPGSQKAPMKTQNIPLVPRDSQNRPYKTLVWGCGMSRGGIGKDQTKRVKRFSTPLTGIVTRKGGFLILPCLSLRSCSTRQGEYITLDPIWESVMPMRMPHINDSKIFNSLGEIGTQQIRNLVHLVWRRDDVVQVILVQCSMVVCGQCRFYPPLTTDYMDSVWLKESCASDILNNCNYCSEIVKEVSPGLCLAKRAIDILNNCNYRSEVVQEVSPGLCLAKRAMCHDILNNCNYRSEIVQEVSPGLCLAKRAMCHDILNNCNYRSEIVQEVSPGLCIDKRAMCQDSAGSISRTNKHVCTSAPYFHSRLPGFISLFSFKSIDKACSDKIRFRHRISCSDRRRSRGLGPKVSLSHYLAVLKLLRSLSLSSDSACSKTTTMNPIATDKTTKVDATVIADLVGKHLSSCDVFGQLVARITYELKGVVEEAVRVALSSVNDEVGRLQELAGTLSVRLEELDDRWRSAVTTWSSTRDARTFPPGGWRRRHI